MKAVLLLARRELAGFLNTWWGWAILAMVLLVDGLFFNAFALSNTPQYSADVLENFFYFASGSTLVAGVLLTMGLLAEERQVGTIVLLETAPVSEAQVIWGKFLGAFGFLALITVLTVYMPALVEVNGKVSWAQIGTGYLGLLSLGAATVAIGTFGSAISKNQLLAAMVGGVLVVLLLLGWLLGRITEPPISEILSYTALFDRHYQPFMRGRINTESLIYYGSLVYLFQLLSTRALQSRRWQ
jgi:ABC-2 type transport system permease protein